MKETEQISSSKPRGVSPYGAAFAVIVVSVLSLLVIFHATTPTGAGPLGILVVFVLAYALFVAAFFMILRLTGSLAARIGKKVRYGTRRTYYVASVLGFVPVLYLTLASMGGVSFWGLSLIVAFVALSLFYVLRRL